jgi:hypothetical protein
MRRSFQNSIDFGKATALPGVCGLGLAYFIEEDFKRCWQGALLELH